MRHYIGVDLGGTNIVCGLLNESLQVLRMVKRPTEASLGYEHVLGTIAEMAEKVAGDAGLSMGEIAAVGAGIPGLVNPELGLSIFAANLRWKKKPVVSDLQDLLGVPVFIDNDVRLFTLGEAVSGAGRGGRVVLGVTLGTGLACGIVREGKLFYGSGYMAGELGHIRMDGESAPCGCGMSGCLETVASATGILRIARERLQQNDGAGEILRSLAPDLALLTSAHVSQAYDLGDPIAVDVMRYAGTILGRGLASAISLLNPDIIVIGGGAAQAGERLLAPVREELRRQVVPSLLEGLQLRLSEIGDNAALIGGVAFVQSQDER